MHTEYTYKFNTHTHTEIHIFNKISNLHGFLVTTSKNESEHITGRDRMQDLTITMAVF